MHPLKHTATVLAFLVASTLNASPDALVLQSDFGLGDGAVSTMQGVAYSVSPNLSIFNLTHEIPPYDIWIAALTLEQTVSYWPSGTVFVSVVDPGVGTHRKSVVLKTRTGHFIVTPDNGTLTFVARSLGISEVREIDESVNRRKQSGASYTFHGRDVYAYTGARLASGTIAFEEVGPVLSGVIMLPFKEADYDSSNHTLSGTILNLDPRYGNVWTNISRDLFLKLETAFGTPLHVIIMHDDTIVFEGDMPYSETFGSVPEGNPLLYLNSLLNVSFALNMGDFAALHHIAYGPSWQVKIIRKLPNQS